MSKQIIVVAGGTGNLGGRIVSALLDKGAEVRVLVRSTSNLENISHLEKIGAKVIFADMTNEKEIATACSGASVYTFRLFIGFYEIYGWRKSKLRYTKDIS